MSSSELQKQWALSYLSGGNMAYVDAMYEDYLKNPLSVPETWRDTFSSLPKINGHDHEASHQEVRDYFVEQAKKPKMAQQASSGKESYLAAELVQAYRSLGHHAAKLDPLEMTARPNIPSLDPKWHQLSSLEMDKTFETGAFFAPNHMPLKEVVHALQETYCSSIGIEYMHISDATETAWLQKRMESVRGKPVFSSEEKKQILADLVAADGMERYLGTRYVGQKRFSLEGGDSFIPLLKEIINRGGANGVKEMVLGMAHRGRLNVLINVLGKAPGQLFEEFEGKIKSEITGDVKYHMGFSSDIKTISGDVVHLALSFNPSHLEIIGPVVQGSVRSRLRRRNDLIAKNTVVPIVIHGDAAFAGQGVVMETFNFSQARGYATGGTIHIVINNQIGFTTSNPLDARSTLYCTDVAKMVQAPVIHVNGEDPEAVVFAAQLALDFRMKFKRDVVIDLVCYRKHGHNEADEPSVTQPMMYQKIKSMKPLRETYGQKLIQEGIIDAATLDNMNNDYRDRLDKGEPVVDLVHGHYDGQRQIDWTPFFKASWDDVVDTTISMSTINRLSKILNTLPEGFTVHPTVSKLLADREKMSANEIPMNWGYAETMAYASLVEEGFGVRLSGQDCGRGTFAHRHAVLHDLKTGETLTPLEQIAKDGSKSFVVIDSVLSEEAVLAFEYGFASSEPNSLVLWEAQFGDFANGAQVVIDQFISSGEQKWGRLCGLTMLLPHGYEGQGPEHSSARLERFMQLCAQHNIQVCTPTTPAQIFHLLRRQMIRLYRKPLVVMTPKSLLRHKLAVSPLSDLCDGRFYNVIPEIDELDSKKVTRVILCGGKVYYDLLQKRRDDKLNDTAIVRIEQLYPFPKEELTEVLKAYPNAKDVVWCQEEPQNQGAWFSSQHNMIECLNEKQRLRYAGRAFAAAPAVGSPHLHAEQQKKLVEDAFSV